MIDKRSLGTGGPELGALGYGAMVLEGYYGASDDAEAVGTIHRALDAGMTMIDSADAYGNGHNERLVGRAVRGRKDAFVATKFGIVFEPDELGADLPTGWGFSLKINGRPDYASRALDASLARLGVDTIDLWYLHYPDPATPIEETVGAMAAAVKAGKVRHLGLSNVTADQVRRAHAVHPIAAVQFEYSLWRREAETALLPTLRQLGIALVAWSPLVQLARELSITPAQLALAWLLHQGRDVIPIPGTRKSARIDENAKSAAIRLDAEQLRRIDAIARPGLAEGATLL